MQHTDVVGSVVFDFPLYCGFSYKRQPMEVSCSQQRGVRAWAVFRTPELAFEYISGSDNEQFEFSVALAKDSRTFDRALIERLSDGFSHVVFDYRADATRQQTSGECVSISDLRRIITTK